MNKLVMTAAALAILTASIFGCAGQTADTGAARPTLQVPGSFVGPKGDLDEKDGPDVSCDSHVWGSGAMAEAPACDTRCKLHTSEPENVMLDEGQCLKKIGPTTFCSTSCDEAGT